MATTEAWRKAFVGEWVDFNGRVVCIVNRLQRLLGNDVGFNEIQKAITGKSIPHQAMHGMSKGERYELTWERFDSRPNECGGTDIYFMEFRLDGSLVMIKETSRGCACHGHTVEWEELMSVY